MYSQKLVFIAAMVAYVQARFGQEQVPIAAISAVQGGASGAAATIAGATISDLLGAANACAKLSRADQIVSELGGGADAIAAAKGLVAAEKNTNPFVGGNVQNVCGDASLPATEELRGIVPLIDPAVDVNGAVAALSAQSLTKPLAANGMSVFDILKQAGLSDLVVAQNAAGGDAGAAAAGGKANAGNQAAAGNQNKGNATAVNNANQGQQDEAEDCEDAAAKSAQGNQQQNNNATSNANQGKQSKGNAENTGKAGKKAGNNNNNAGAAAGAAAADGAADFGKCTPTITFQGGEGNRPATEFTFQIADSVARGGQGEALNPNIITNALCNQLTNVCDANAAAKALCEDGKAKVAAAGTRNKSTADLFNAAVGFPGAVTNPAGGPDDVPAAAASARAMRRGLRI